MADVIATAFYVTAGVFGLFIAWMIWHEHSLEMKREDQRKRELFCQYFDSQRNPEDQ